jgi:hypothetical protein
MPVMIEKHGAIASRANMGDFLQDTGTVPSAVADVLEQTITPKGRRKCNAAFTSMRNACTAWKPSNRPA